MTEKILIQQNIKQGNFSKGGEASTKLKRKLARLGVNSAVIRKASIVTYELEMNVIIHSYGGEIKVIINLEELIIKVEDVGPGIENLDRAFKPGYSTADHKIRELGFGAGMGLNNVKKYTNELAVKTDSKTGTKIEAIIYLVR